MSLQISENKNKRSRICKISYAFASDLIINNYPGDSIQVIGNFSDVRFSSANFSEILEANGEQYNQELLLEIKGNDSDTQKTISDLTGKYIILKLEYTNQEVKIVGTNESPLMLLHQQSGTPVVNNLSFSRNSAEKAKYIIS